MDSASLDFPYPESAHAMIAPRYPTLLHPALVCMAFLLGAATGRGEDIDLTRLTPVSADQPIPIADFFRSSRIRTPSINDAGTRIAGIVVSETDEHQLMILDVATWETEFLRGQNEKEVSRYTWLTDDRIMFNLSYQRRYADSMLVAELGKRTKTYYLNRFGVTRIIGVPEDNPLRPIVWIRGGTKGKKDLGPVELNAKLNIDNRRPSQRNLSDWDFAQYVNEQHIVGRYPTLASDWGQVVDYQSDRSGNLAYAYTVRDGVPRLHALQDKEWHASPIDLDAYDIHQVADTPGNLIASEMFATGEPGKLVELNTRSGETGKLIFQDPAYNFTGALYRDRHTKRIVGAIYDRAGPTSVWFDPSYEKLQQSLNGFFPGRVVRIRSSNDQVDRFIVQVYSDQAPASYHLVDLKQKKVTLISETRPWLDPERMNRMNIIQFKTAEGIELDAYVTLPRGASKEHPAPLVVLPHGGPWARDYWGFNPEVQFLASRGYAVLQPNFRGSTGSAWRFPKDDNWDFFKMHDDVTRATKALAASGYVDPDRIAIMGSSFGGYLAVMGAVEEPDLYQCAVSFAGVFDWEEMVKTAAVYRHENPKHQLLIRHLGDPRERPEFYDRISPLRRVDQIRIPVLVAHGKEDQVVSVGESRRLIRELEDHGIEHQALLLSDERHGTAFIENSVELYSHIEQFLARHL